MARPRGPHKISANGQLVIPRDLMREVAWSPQEEVYLLPNEGGVLVVLAATVEAWIDKGRRTKPAKSDRGVGS